MILVYHEEIQIARQLDSYICIHEDIEIDR